MSRWMMLLALLLLIVFLMGLVGTYYFWPHTGDHQSGAFFSFLQFLAAFALILLTFLYVVSTQRYVEQTQEVLSDQNRAPKISITRHYYPQTDPFIANFVVEIANPRVRATSVTIKKVQIGQENSTELHFEINQSSRDRATIQARDLIEVIVKARFDRIPILVTTSQERSAVLTFEDVFHGTLRPITYQL
jgi:magnesium-transporting ATPase (P-type)